MSFHSICCHDETPTSNIMDFCLFPSFSTSLVLLIPLLDSVLSWCGCISPPIFTVVDARYILGGCNEFSQTGLEKKPLTSWGGDREGVYTVAAHQPWRKAWQFSAVALYCKSVSIPWLPMLHLFQWQTGEQIVQSGETICTTGSENFESEVMNKCIDFPLFKTPKRKLDRCLSCMKIQMFDCENNYTRSLWEERKGNRDSIRVHQLHAQWAQHHCSITGHGSKHH